MVTLPLILAQEGSDPSTATATGENAVSLVKTTLQSNLDVFTQPEKLNALISQIHIVWAGIFVLVGIACILNGYRWHKSVVIVLAVMSGVWCGQLLGPTVGDATVAAVCISVLFGVLAWPMLRYAVALFGGLAGAFAGANVWTAAEFAQDQHRIGALVGLVAVGMLSFMAFRGVVIVMTSIGGASLLMLGSLAAFSQVPAWQSGLQNGLQSNRLMVPVIVASLSVIGAVIQFSGGFKGMAAIADQADPANVKAKKAA